MMANLGCQFDIPRKRNLQRRNCLHWIGLWPCLGSHFLDCYLWKRAQCTVGDGTSRQVDLWCVIKVTEQASEQHPSTPLQSFPPRFCLQLLPWLPFMTSYNLQAKENPFLPQFDFSQCFVRIEKQTRTAFNTFLSILCDICGDFFSQPETRWDH